MSAMTVRENPQLTHVANHVEAEIQRIVHMWYFEFLEGAIRSRTLSRLDAE